MLNAFSFENLSQVITTRSLYIILAYFDHLCFDFVFGFFNRKSIVLSKNSNILCRTSKVYLMLIHSMVDLDRRFIDDNLNNFVFVFDSVLWFFHFVHDGTRYCSQRSNFLIIIIIMFTGTSTWYSSASWNLFMKHEKKRKKHFIS